MFFFNGLGTVGQLNLIEFILLEFDSEYFCNLKMPIFKFSETKKS